MESVEDGLILKTINSSNLLDVFKIYQSNQAYFKLKGESQITLDLLKTDQEARPPQKKGRTTNYIKRFEAISWHQSYVGVIDYLLGYPSKKTVFIGLLLIDDHYKGQKIGSHVVTDLSDKWQKEGYENVRLGVLVSNTTAFSFWKKQGFKIVEKSKTYPITADSFDVWIMERSIKQKPVKP